MIQNVLQCCYTNAITETGNVVSSGWKAVCVSPDLPSDAFSFCTRIQNANSSILNAMRDESGAVLNLLEICGDGSYICMIRTQYGLMDRLGRENMFSHAYIFPCRDKNTIRDPNAFLTIDNSNFKYSEEAANELAPAFARLPAFRIESALEACGLSKETYLKLIQCVYAQMSDKKSTRPLYIQYDGSETTLRALLYCIYYGLPFAFRKKLSVSSVKTDNTTGKNLIFSVKAREQELFIDPKTGDNSVLTARMERRLSRLGFLSYAVRNIAHPNILNYFDALEAKALELGDSTGQNELFLKIAHILLISKDVRDVEDSELDTRLSDALRVNSIGNRTMDEYIAKLLSEITARKLVLTEENEAALNERIDAAGSGLLKDAVEQYNFYRFNELSAAEAASRLSAMSPAVFAEYRGKLRKTENGARILDYYYAEIKSKSCADSWKAIAQLYAETNDLPSRPLTGDKVDTLAWNLYERGLEKVREGDVSGAVQEYKYYMTIMQARFGARNAAGSGIAAKEAFWDQVSYDNIAKTMLS